MRAFVANGTTRNDWWIHRGSSGTNDDWRGAVGGDSWHQRRGWERWVQWVQRDCMVWIDPSKICVLDILQIWGKNGKEHIGNIFTTVLGFSVWLVLTYNEYRTEFYYFWVIFGSSWSMITEPICLWNKLVSVNDVSTRLPNPLPNCFGNYIRQILVEELPKIKIWFGNDFVCNGNTFAFGGWTRYFMKKIIWITIPDQLS